MNTYKTAEIAKVIGVHPNTVRLYEKLRLIPATKRKENGYRVFTDFHLEQFRLARIALKVEILQSGLRKKAINIIKTSAIGNFNEANRLANEYLQQIDLERRNAEEAIKIVNGIISGATQEKNDLYLKRKETADFLAISMDTLRNWEMNGLLTVRRQHNGYRVYNSEDIMRLKIIRSLRCANYSLSAILRMMGALSGNPEADIREVIDTPNESDDIVSVCDKFLTSLDHAEMNANSMLAQLEKIKKIIKINPPL